MGASLAAILTRMVRTAMLEELGQDYIRTARAKGLSERAVVWRHALPNALVPIVTVVGLQFGALAGGGDRDRKDLQLAGAGDGWSWTQFQIAITPWCRGACCRSG